jgi:hypothetical protein
VPSDDAGRDPAGPVAPSIPSFTSLRGPRGSSPVDVLVPREPRPEPRPQPRSAVPPVPRPAEWADLWPFGLRVLRAVVAAPVGLVRQLLGG